MSIDRIHSFKHRDHIFRRDISEYIMHLLKDKPASLFEDGDLFTNVLLDFLRASLRQDGLCVATAPPEDHLAAKFSFQIANIHSFAAYLNRIDRIQPGVNQVGEKLPDSSTAMEHDFDVGDLLRSRPHELVPRLEELTIHRRGNLRTSLHTEIIPEHDDVDRTPNQAQVPIEVHQVKFGKLIEESMRLSRVIRQEH